MDTFLRESGIGLIGSVPWGTHIGQFYTSKVDLQEVIVPYIKSGLLNNELCLWIYSQDFSREDIKEILREQVSGVEAYMEKGQLILMPHTDWYIKDDGFDEKRVNRQWNELIRHSLERGFDGLRAAADVAWLDKRYFRQFLHYEDNINRIISELPFIVICLYNGNNIDTFETAGIISNHSYIITRYEGKVELIENVELCIKSKQLEETRDKYRPLLQLLPDSVFIHDNNRIYYCNESALSLTGYSNPGELHNKSLMQLISPDNRNEFGRFVRKLQMGNTASNYLQSRIICRGEVKNVEIVSTEFMYMGKKALLSVVRDVTHVKKIVELERTIKENEELLNDTLAYDKMKTEFFSNMSHELRTPLHVILSAIQLMKVQNEHAGQNNENRCLKIMQQNCFRLLRLVNNLIDITKIEADYFEIKPQNYDIVGLVEEITMSVVEYGRNKGIAIAFDTDIEEKEIACDPDQIERIVLNLLSNSIKFTPCGGFIWVNVFDRGDYITISVKDTGIGIPLDKQKYIFNRFQQVDKSLTRQHEGSGIGLSLVKALVEKHNGTISLISQLGSGSEFIINLPCQTIDCQELSQQTDCGNSSYFIERINIEFSDIYT